MKELAVVNPFDLKPIGSVSQSSWVDVDRMLDVAQKLYRNRKGWLPAHQRISILEKAAVLMNERFEDLAFQIANEGGKPLSDARVEVARAVDGVKLCAKELLYLRGEEIPMGLTKAGSGRMAFTTREPIGPVVAVSAFNHPLNLIVHQVTPAIAVGAPVIIKPAQDTPLSALSYVNILYEAGLPEEWCQFVMCDIPTAQAMVTDSRTAFLSFIGSAKVGWMLRSKLAPGTRCALEHGGVAPVIVDRCADLDAMIPGLVKGGFYHAGQVCVSVQRVLVPQDMVDEVAQRIAQKASLLQVGNAIEEGVDIGPLIRPKEVDRVERWVEEARALGATVVTGGERLGATTYAPTVLINPPKHAKVSKDEIFGPVVNVNGYNSLDQAIEMANELPFAFQTSVFTQDIDSAMRCARGLEAAAVMINDHTAVRVDWMPFAGYQHSGYGVGGMRYTMQDMAPEKLVVLKLKS
ncbi:MAG: aldehyde dehydrogenase [Proteobacteria bacterium]|nr:aldehyde dehydrogenase [Pseudomonadota bacterium]